MTENQLRALKQKVREILFSGFAIAVIGWKDSNHSIFTRNLSKDFIIFHDASPGKLSERIGFVLFTRFVSHSVINKVKSKKSSCPVVIDTGRIKAILESCKDLLEPITTDQNAKDHSCVVSETSDVVTTEHQNCNDLLDYLTKPSKEILKMSNMDKFTKAFINLASITKGVEGKVISSQILRNLIAEFHVNRTPQQLIKDGWVDPVASEGKGRAHWYKAGRLMCANNDKEEKLLPETAAGRVEFLLSQEPALLSEKMKLQERTMEIDKMLSMIESAKKMFSEIDEVLNSQK